MKGRKLRMCWVMPKMCLRQDLGWFGGSVSILSRKCHSSAKIDKKIREKVEKIRKKLKRRLENMYFFANIKVEYAFRTILDELLNRIATTTKLKRIFYYRKPKFPFN